MKNYEEHLRFALKTHSVHYGADHGLLVVNEAESTTERFDLVNSPLMLKIDVSTESLVLQVWRGEISGATIKRVLVSRTGRYGPDTFRVIAKDGLGEVDDRDVLRRRYHYDLTEMEVMLLSDGDKLMIYCPEEAAEKNWLRESIVQPT
ncbi:MAG: hypothetical protein AAGN35_06565 [Bacteroidota bacterium]